MFKMMENGELLAAEIFPAVGREFSKVANAAGALEVKYKTTRVAQGRFFKELEKGMNTIFESGFDEGMAEIFNNLAAYLKENQQTLKAFGRIFEVVFRIIGAALRMVLPVLDSVVSSVGELFNAFDKVFGKGSGEIVIGVYAITRAVQALNVATARLMIKWLAIVGLIDEAIAPFVKGRVGLIEIGMGQDLSAQDMSNMMSNTPLGKVSKNISSGLAAPEQLRMNSLSEYMKNIGAGVSIQQDIKVEVPAGANEEHFKGITKQVIDEATQSAINNAYMGGQ